MLRENGRILDSPAVKRLFLLPLAFLFRSLPVAFLGLVVPAAAFAAAFSLSFSAFAFLPVI
jgi:uncharacterized membrane protein